MAKKKAGNARTVTKRKAGIAPLKQTANAGAVLPKLTEAEQDLVWHVENGHQLETDSLGGNPVLRSLKDGEVVRLTSANRNRIKALEKRVDRSGERF